jgi:hypothetical protein
MSRTPIFIHSLFRTGSTYIWNKFRQKENYYCYYEPLHPVLAQVSTENIEFILTRDFQSVHHPALDKYYLYEYLPLLIKGEPGVPFFKKSFSYDEFCRNDFNPELKQYIDYLLAGAGEKVPLLQFNRTALRTRWFKTNYPDSLNIYLVRNPRDQWQSYFELYKRTNYREFFVMDFLLVSVNEDKEDFKALSQHLPLLPFNHRDHAKEKNFYNIILDCYSNEEKYFLFYYLWLRALAENLLNADLVIDINRLSHEAAYKTGIKEILNTLGISDIDFDDANLTEYSTYPLAIEMMARFEDTVQKLLIPGLGQNRGDDFSRKLSPGSSSYFNFQRGRFPGQQENGYMPDPFPGSTPERIMEILKKMVSTIAGEYGKQIEKCDAAETLLLKKIAAAPTENLWLAREYWETREKGKLMSDLEDQLTKRDWIIYEKDQLIGQLEQELEARHLGLAEKDDQVKQNNIIIREKDRLLLQKDQEMRMKAHQLAVEIKRREQSDLELQEKTQQLLKIEQEIQKLRGSYTYRTGKVITAPAKAVKRIISKPLSNWLSRSWQNSPWPWYYFLRYERKIDLADQLQADFGRHRSGLKYGLGYLKVLHQAGGVVLDVFIERTFCWHPQGIEPHTKPWIGFIHVPPNVPDWFIYEQSNEMIFASEAWKQSLLYCRGLFTLSRYHKKYLETKLDIPVDPLIFPTEIPGLKWSFDKFAANKEKKIIQVGWWLRKLHAIYQFPKTAYKKVFLNVEHEILPHLMNIERKRLEKEGTFNDEMYDTAEQIGFLPDKEYDKLLSENIVFIYLYDASANNTITECIARSTPILINPIEPVKEYLGEDYPFYYHTLEEAAAKAMNLDLVYKTHQYLAQHPIKKKLSGKYFLESFVKSGVYKGL